MRRMKRPRVCPSLYIAGFIVAGAVFLLPRVGESTRLPEKWYTEVREVRLRGGTDRDGQHGLVDTPIGSMAERLAAMDETQMKALARKFGVLEDGTHEKPGETSWLERQNQIALKVLRRRANEDKKERQRRHQEKHGLDAATVARAEEVQRLIAEGQWSAIDQLSSYGRHVSKQKRLAQLHHNDTLTLTKMLELHLERKVAQGGSSELTKHDKIVVLQQFLEQNKRSPHLRAVLAHALNTSADHAPNSSTARDELLSSRADSSTHATERQRRDIAQGAQPQQSHPAGATVGAGASGRSGGAPGEEVLSGKKLRKAQAQELREATAYDREEENQPLAPRFKERVEQYRSSLQGPALLSAEYLEDAAATGRFAWPPLADGPMPNITTECVRCERLKLSACLCTDIHGKCKLNTPAMDPGPGPSGIADQDGMCGAEASGQNAGWDAGGGGLGDEEGIEVLDYESSDGDGKEEEEGSGDGSDWQLLRQRVAAAGLAPLPPLRSEPIHVNYVFEEETGRLTITNNPFGGPGLLEALNVSGDMPMVADRWDWPWVNSLGLPGSDRSALLDASRNEADSEADDERNVKAFFGPCLPGVAAVRRGRRRVSSQALMTETVSGDGEGRDYEDRYEPLRGVPGDGEGRDGGKEGKDHKHGRSKQATERGAQREGRRGREEKWAVVKPGAEKSLGQVCGEGGDGLQVLVMGLGARRAHVLGGVLEKEWKVAESLRRIRAGAQGGRGSTGEEGQKRAFGGDAARDGGYRGWWERRKKRNGDVGSAGSEETLRDWGRVVLTGRKVCVRGASEGVWGDEGGGDGGLEGLGGEAWRDWEGLGGVLAEREESSLDTTQPVVGNVNLGNTSGSVVEGQWVLVKGGSGVVADLCCQLTALPTLDSGEEAQDSQRKWTRYGLGSGEKKREVTEEEFRRVSADDELGIGAEDGPAGGEMACIGACGGEWSFEACRIVAGSKLDALRCSFGSQVTAWGCDIAITALHRSRVVVERSVILPTEYSAIRAMDRSRFALNHSRFEARTLYTLEIGADAHVALRKIYHHRLPEKAVELDKHCYIDNLPLYRPSLLCDWCPRWVGGGDMGTGLGMTEEDAAEERRQYMARRQGAGPKVGSGGIQGIESVDFLIPRFDVEAESQGGDEVAELGHGGEGEGAEMLTTEAAGGRSGGVTMSTLDYFLYHDETLDGETFVNGSVLGSWRPWCPPGFVEKFREAFPNGIALANAGGALLDGDFEDMLAEMGQESCQNLADSGFKFSELAGAEELAVEGAGDAEGDVAEEAPRGHGEARRRGGARRRGHAEEERRGKQGRRKKKTSAWKKQSAYAPD